MATLIDANRVKYLCSCSRLKPLSSLYYCKYCESSVVGAAAWSLKCKECVLHEVDQKYFCTYCFDHKVHKDVSGLKYKCATCFSCPCCKNSLITRASSIKSSNIGADGAAAAAAAATVVTTQTAQTSTKVYYLICGFCRWTSRDAGLPDALITPVTIKSKENPWESRIQALLSAYKVVATREKLEKEKKKYPTTTKRRTFQTGSPGTPLAGLGSSPSDLKQLKSSTITGTPGADKYGILAPVFKHLQQTPSPAKQTAIDPETGQLLSHVEQFKKLLQEPAQTVATFESDLHPDTFTSNTLHCTLTSVSQRHAAPEFQPKNTNEIYPLNKFYISKESKRCNGCEHNVLKPESNITSTKFKLHQMAIFLVPEIRIVTLPAWKPNVPNEVILSITNRCEFDLRVSLVTLSDSANISGFEPTADIHFSSDEIVVIDKQDNSKGAQVPALKPADLETRGLVCFRRDNKIAILCQVTPKLGGTDGRVRVAFGLRHYLETLPTATTDSSSTNEKSMLQKIFIDFGPSRLEDGAKFIPKPKYIEDCVAIVSAK